MKRCPACNRTYADESLTFCLIDGSVLSAPYDPHETQRVPDPRDTDPAPTEVLYPTPSDPTPSLPKTILSPQPPPLVAEKPQHQSQEGRSSKTWLSIGAVVFFMVMSAAVATAGFIWLYRDKTTDEQADPKVSNNTAIPAGTPGSAPSVTGRWSGSWENTKGEKGTSTINIVEETSGLIKGDEDGWAIVNGRRSGNTLSWEYRGQNSGCRDYQVRLEIDADGRRADGTYEVSDRCKNATYRGRYNSYKKQSGASGTSAARGYNLNPIEKCWPKVKTALRRAKARTREALEAASKEALLTITKADAPAWFVHCGYPAH